MLRFLPVILLALSLTACDNSSNESTDLRIDDAWVRSMPEGTDRTAAYFTITNASQSDWRMSAARTDAAGTTELHVTTIENDVMQMRHVDGFDIAAGETYRLEPGGPHIMLLDVDGQLAEGDSVVVVLVFEEAGNEGASTEVEITAPVRAG